MRGGRRWTALLLLAALLSTGCWDRREIEEESLVLATGFDPCPEEAEEGCAFVVSRQIAIPGRIPLGAGEGQGPAEKTVEVIQVPAVSGPDSAVKAQAMLNRELRFGHTRVLVFAEELARTGLAELTDYTRRVPEAPRLLWVTVSAGPAEEVIRARPPLEPLPAIFLNDMIQEAVEAGRLPRVSLGEFLTRISNEGEDPVAPLIRMAGPDQPELAGLAVFRGDRLVGMLSPEESVSYLQLRGVKQGAELIKVELDDGRTANVNITGRQVEHQVVQRRGGGLTAEVKIRLEGQLSQVDPGVESETSRALDVIERAAARQLTDRMTALLAKVQQEFRADIFGVGEQVRAHLPTVWSGISDWHETFAGLRFAISVQVQLRRTGPAID